MIHYSVTPQDLHGHLFSVELTLEQPAAVQVFRLPAWLPGSYMVRDFAKNLIDLSAVDHNNQPCAIVQLDKQTWQVNTDQQPIKICYQVYALDLSVRTAYLDSRRGFFNGSSLFLEIAEQSHLKHEVTLHPPVAPMQQDWLLATSMTRESGEQWQFGRFSAQNYDELIDHPVEMGHFSHAHFFVDDIRHDVVLAGRHHADLNRLCADLEKICRTQLNLFGAPAPFKEYLFMTAVLENGYGGLEHRNSTALMCSRKDLPTAASPAMNADYRNYLSLCSHEYFHSWNVKRIKPARFVPYALQAESYTTQLWAYEGITSYYDDLLTYRSGCVDQATYLEMLAQLMTRVYRGSGRFKQSLLDSSFNAWTKFYQQDENAQNAIVSYYTKGALFALFLDLTLRSETQGKHNLDDVMRHLWQVHGITGIGTQDDTHQQIVSELLQRNTDDLFAYLENTKDLPLADLLAQFGVEMIVRPSAGNNDTGGHAPQGRGLRIGFGAKYQAQPLGVKIITVTEGSPAMQAGLSANDLLIAADGLKATANLEQFLQNYHEGETIELVWLRGDELMIGLLTITPAVADTVELVLVDAEKVKSWLG